jgi:tetratricopeptide (TPR) repeat protein
MNKNKDLKIEETFNLAVKNHQEGKLDIAQELYNQTLKINPGHSQALNNLAVIFTNLKEYQKAKDCYKKAIESDPNYADAHNNLGVVFKDLGENQKAKDCYIKAIELNPNYVNAYYNIGLVCKELGEHQKAKECFEKVIELNPNHVDANNNLGNIFTDFKEYQKAKKCFEKAIEINPDYSSAHNNLGAVFQKLGEDKKAKDCYEKAIKINPGYALAHDNLKTMLNRQILLSKIEKAKKSQNRNTISFKKKIHKKLFGSDLKLNSNPFISHRKVEEELINIIYQLNYKYLNKTNNTFYGNGRHSSNFRLFENNYSILKKMEDDLITIMEQAVKSDIFIMDSFFNVLSNGGGSNWHNHTGAWDDVHNLNKQKYSLTYHIAIGDQKSNEPGILKFKDPQEEILPSKGMVMIFTASRSHSAFYNGKVDRVMIGVNFYSLI